VFDRHTGFLGAVVAVEPTEGAPALFDHPQADCFRIYDLPANRVAVVDIDFLPDTSGDGCLRPQSRALGVNAVLPHSYVVVEICVRSVVRFFTPEDEPLQSGVASGDDPLPLAASESFLFGFLAGVCAHTSMWLVQR